MQYKIIRSKRRTLVLEISSGLGVLVRSPLKITDKDIDRFVQSKAAWIEKVKLKIQNNKAPKSIPKDVVFLYGKEYKIVNDGGKFILLGDGSLDAGRDVVSFFKVEAFRYIQERVRYFEGVMKVKSRGKINIGKGVKLLGFCTKEGQLTFSFRVIMAPPLSIDALVVHELAHIIHKKHGVRFYTMVYKYFPEYKQHHVWFKKHVKIMSNLASI